MRTYQDLEKVGENLLNIGEFCRSAIDEFMASKEYQEAKAGQAYYDKHNITIENYQKFLYTVSGNRIADVWGANYKIKTLFFRRLILQQVQYVLGNGLTLQNEDNKARLGKDFDYKLQLASKIALAQGRAFGFWNLDHLEVFGFADTPSQAGFCPLYDENTAELRAGIRFWFKRVKNKLICRFDLYTEDGITQFAKSDKDDVKIMSETQPYIVTKISTEAGGVEKSLGENYDRLPIIPLYANDTQQSELVGMRESIDCYDFIKSGLANVIDDNADVFWLVANSGGMSDPDLAKFVQRIKTVHSASVDAEDGQSATPHTIDVPYDARKTMLEILRKDIYEDFQALDVNTLSASAKTTQEIQAAYQSQDNKCADFEYLVIDFVQHILELAGIDDNPTFVWNKVVNMAEQTNMVLMSASLLPEELVIKHLPFLTPEEAESAINKNQNMASKLFNAGDDE